MKICVVVRTEPDPVAGHLVLLRDTVNARIFLGCIVDGADGVQEWLELWIQNGGGLGDVLPAAAQVLSNRVLDERWKQQCRAFDEIDAPLIVKIGWECEHPRPMFIDAAGHSPVHPVEDGSGAAWRLCTDEALLQDKGLPGYGGSLHRYWYLPELGAESPLVPVSPGAPANESTKPMSEVCGDPATMIPLNPQARLMLVKKYVPTGLETFVDVLSGKPWGGLRHGKSVLDLHEPVNALGADQGMWGEEGWLFLETQGRSGRLLETFHLKLRLLADVVSSVRSLVYHLQRPLFTLSPESWRVELGAPGPGLPFFWTARAALTDSGSAVPLAIEKSDFQYYLPSQAGGTSVYRPLESSLPSHGRASIRIRQVSTEERGPTVVEGTFATQERLEMARHDLAWFRLALACGDINLYAHLETDSALAAGEWRFRTVAQSMDETALAHLRQAEGVPMTDVLFEVIPLLSSPCDLYSLAVVALRILLVDQANSLPTVVDEALSLLRQSEAEADGSVDMEQRICEAFGSDPRWRDALGPQHLTVDEMTPDEAFQCVPASLWWTTLAMVLRMFPGPGPYRQCKDSGDAPQGGLHKIFDRTLADVRGLIRRTRSLVVTDWEANREINAVLRKFLA
ncbi:MAG: hypothetical protein JW741_16325 [Sedimentisphaerales bacterium]|nr:hypothetical protein [Sedimentisphaerales bacterium]